MKHGIIDYEIIGEGTPVLIIHGWGICRITMKAAFEPVFTKLEGEKNFNPVYMLLQVCDDYPLLVLNENLCIVEYQQDDSMSRGIYRQYMNSPRSFAKLRLLEMTLKRNTFKHHFRSAVHYVSSCLIAKDRNWLKQASKKWLVLLAAPFGLVLSLYIKSKAKK